MESNYPNKDQIVDKTQQVTRESILNDETMENEGLLSKKNLILALLLFLFILFFSILAYSAKYYFDNQNQRPATVQAIPQAISSTPSSSTSTTSSSSLTASSSSSPAVIEPKPGVINSDGGLLIRKEDGSLKYPNPNGPVQGSFSDKESIKIDSTKGKKEFTIGNEKLTFVYGTGTNKDGWIAEKYIVYK
jgi:cytoskeletal protein RodZ